MPRSLYQLLLTILCVGSHAHFIKPHPDDVVLGRWWSDFDDFGAGPYSDRDESYTGRDVITEDCGGRMTDDLRLTLLRVHNKERSKVAQGNYKIDAGPSPLRKLPPATHMYQLKYNCSLEASALKWAKMAQCRMKHSKWPGIGENLYASGSPRSLMYAANESASMWADEIRKYGVENDINEWTHSIGHATQMFWDRTYSVGCGVIKCDDDQTSVVCHYYPQGNWPGEKWYTAGDTLSECGKPRKQHPDLEEGWFIIEDSDEHEKRRRKEKTTMEVAHPDTGLCEISAQESEIPYQEPY